MCYISFPRPETWQPCCKEAITPSSQRMVSTGAVRFTGDKLDLADHPDHAEDVFKETKATVGKKNKIKVTNVMDVDSIKDGPSLDPTGPSSALVAATDPEDLMKNKKPDAEEGAADSSSPSVSNTSDEDSSSAASTGKEGSSAATADRFNPFRAYRKEEEKSPEQPSHGSDREVEDSSEDMMDEEEEGDFSAGGLWGLLPFRCGIQ